MKSVKIIYLFIFICVILIFWKQCLRETWYNVVCYSALPSEKDRVLVQVIKHKEPIIKSGISQKIPKIIIQTNEKNLVPVEMKKSMQHLIEMNPEYEYKYFDNNDVLVYLKENFPERIVAAYNKLKPGAYKADFFRYCILYEIGGVYIDSPMLAKAALSSLIKPEDEFISPEDNFTGAIYNAFICCVPKHPIIKQCIEKSLKNIENEFYGSGPLVITGPELFSEAFESVVGSKVQADKNYGNGIKLITHIADIESYLCPSLTKGSISYKDKDFFITRYPNYYVDRIWYNSSKRYSDMWKEKNVFHPT